MSPKMLKVNYQRNERKEKNLLLFTHLRLGYNRASFYRFSVTRVYVCLCLGVWVVCLSDGFELSLPNGMFECLKEN